jgi:hypothetical protein
MTYQGRVGPDLVGIVRDLERLCGAPGSAPAAPAPAPAAAPAADDGLDFSDLTPKA